jgi:hypothetical protein
LGVVVFGRKGREGREERGFGCKRIRGPRGGGTLCPYLM